MVFSSRCTLDQIVRTVVHIHPQVPDRNQCVADSDRGVLSVRGCRDEQPNEPRYDCNDA